MTRDLPSPCFGECLEFILENFSLDIARSHLFISIIKTRANWLSMLELKHPTTKNGDGLILKKPSFGVGRVLLKTVHSIIPVSEDPAGSKITNISRYQPSSTHRTIFLVWIPSKGESQLGAYSSGSQSAWT